MMGIVTLTGHVGAMGSVAERVAKALGYNLVGRELVVEAAAALGWPAAEAAEFDERTGGFGRRLSEFLERFALTQVDPGGGIPAFSMSYADAARVGVPAGERYFGELNELVLALADQGDVVIVGRGAQAILAGHPDALHVRVACPVEERSRRVAARDQITPEAARSLVEHSDSQREAWHTRYLGIDYRSPYHYSLVVNTGSMSDAVAARLIVTAVEARIGTSVT